jgi:hypothetical protein
MAQKGYYFTHKSSYKIEFHYQEWMQFRDKNLVALSLPEGVKIVFCENNKLIKLILPQSVEHIRCDMMNGIEQQDRKGLRINIDQKK